MMDAAESALKINRSGVVEQAATALRAAIRTGELSDPLPGGYQLARILGVSRPSVRAALRRLAAEGVIVLKQGHRTRLTKLHPARVPAAQHGVCVVYPTYLDSPSFLVHPIIMEMRVQFANHGIRWESVCEPRFGGNLGENHLQQMVNSRSHVCWILLSLSEAIQRWFAAAEVPAFVLGSCAGNVRLPSVDVDFGAIGRHAAGAMVSHGHTEAGLILPATLLTGDAACREGFLQAAAQCAAGMTVTEFRAPADQAQLRKRLAQFLLRLHRPTALLVTRAPLALTTITEVLGAGLKIPRDMSIVLRDTDPLIESGLPEYTRYSNMSVKLVTRAVKIAVSLLTGRDVPVKPSLITPTFVPGATLVACGRAR